MCWDDMTKDELFISIQEVVEQRDLDVRTEANFSVLPFSTGKIRNLVMGKQVWDSKAKNIMHNIPLCYSCCT